MAAPLRVLVAARLAAVAARAVAFPLLLVLRQARMVPVRLSDSHYLCLERLAVAGRQRPEQLATAVPWEGLELRAAAAPMAVLAADHRSLVLGAMVGLTASRRQRKLPVISVAEAAVPVPMHRAHPDALGSCASTGRGDMRRLLRGLLVSALIGSSASAQAPQMGGRSGLPPAEVATIMVNTGGSGITIPQDFMGLSAEVGDLILGYYQPGGLNISYLGLVSLLGTHGVLRVGGNSSDSTPTAPALTQQIANNLHTFMSSMGSGWSLIYGLDMKINNTATAATHAGFIATAFGATNVTFHFGNEPDAYLSTVNYETQWNAYYTAVTAAVTGAKYDAWDASSFCCNITVALGLTPGTAGLNALTNHYYAPYGNVNSTTMQQILTDVATTFNNAAGFTSSFFQLNGIAVADGLKQRLTETNSVNLGGQAGITDRMFNTAWVINEAIAFANNGWAGINIHGTFKQVNGGPGLYNPVNQLSDGNFGPGPIFYGMDLFSKIEGQQILPSSFGGGNINEIATKGSNGNANIVVVNNDISHSVIVIPQQSGPWKTASVLQVTDGTGLGCSDAAPMLGGKPIGESGVWTGAPSIIVNGGSILLPPCGTALIQIQP